MEDTILSIPFMKKSVLFPIFKLYGPIVHFCHRLHLLSSFKKKDKVHSVVIFTALNIRQPGQWCLGEAALWLLSLLPQVTFQTTERGGESGSLDLFPSAGEGSWKPQEATREDFSQEGIKENTRLWLFAVSPPRLGSVTFTPREETIWGWGKNRPKGLERMDLRANPEEFLFLTGQRGKAAQNTWKEFASKGGQKLVNTIPVPLTKASKWGPKGSSSFQVMELTGSHTKAEGYLYKHIHTYPLTYPSGT